MKSRRKISSIQASLYGFGALFCITGCAVEADDDTSDSEIETTEQEFSAGGSWGLSGSGSQAHLLGSSTGTVSFLMAVGGNMAGTSNLHVFDAGGNAEVHLHGANVLNVVGGIVFPVTATQEAFFTNADNGTSATMLAPYNGGATRCFLTEISNTSTAHNFGVASDYVKIFEQGGRWYLGGGGFVRGGARCGNVTTPLGGTEVAGVGTWDLGPNLAGKSCWLTGVGGAFRTNSATDGVRIRYNPSSLRWQLVITGGHKYAQAECGI